MPDPSDLGESLTRATARLALLGYGPAAALLLLRLPLAARLPRTLGCLAYLVHVAVAFHYYHHWSHAAAVRHIEAASGFGGGLVFSHLFTLLWALDVTWCWASPAGYARRPRWVAWAVHGYLAFLVFNATVVFETGVVRPAGAALFAVLGALWFRRPRGRSKEGAS